MHTFSKKSREFPATQWQFLKAIPGNFREMRAFSIIWLGQCVSIIGSGLTRFALGLWVYQHTGSVTRFAFIALASILPHLLLSPLAGALVDRWDRRKVMILSDIGAGISTFMIAFLFFTNRLEVWHIYFAAAISSACGTFQWPAYTAAITLLVPKKNLGRANGMVQFGKAVSEILTPLLAGVLLVTIHMWGIIFIDVVTFVLAVITLLFIRVPSHKTVSVEQKEKHSLLHEALYGWKYISARSGLLGLLLFFAVVNFLWGTVGALIVPMILNFTTADVLGIIISVAGGGLFAGSLVMSVWGGPKRRIHGVLHFELFSGFCFLLIGLQPFAPLVALGAFCAHFTIAIIKGSNQAIWQSKVPPEVQGRVFAMRQMVSNSLKPLAFLLAGVLADKVFEPLLAADGLLAGNVGQIIGVGPGRGIACIFLIMGLIKILVSFSAYLYPRVRLVEDDLPDAIAGEPVSAPITLHTNKQHSGKGSAF